MPRLSTTLPLLACATAWLSLDTPTTTNAAANKRKTTPNLDDDGKFSALMAKEHDLDEEVLGKLDVEQPVMLYANFPPTAPPRDKKDLDELATQWLALLKSASVRVTIWGASKNQVLVTAF